MSNDFHLNEILHNQQICELHVEFNFGELHITDDNSQKEITALFTRISSFSPQHC